VDAVHQSDDLPIVLLVKGEQVVGHELHGGVVFLLLQGFHAGDPGRAVLLQWWEESHGCTSDGLFVELAQVSWGFAGDGLVGVGELKTGCSHAPSFSYVGEVFTLCDVDGDFTALDAMFYILTAFILGMPLYSKSLHGGIQELGESFGVETVATDPNTFGHLWVWEESTVVVCEWKAEGVVALLLLKVRKSWQWDSSVGVGDDEGGGVPSFIRCQC
jgi:hypothetical protein